MVTIDRLNPPILRWGRGVPALVVLLMLVGLAPAARAQQQTGNLYGTVSNELAGLLPGVRVELTGIGAPRIQSSDSQGKFRFLGLDPGVYKLNLSLDGFKTLEYKEVDIRVAKNTTLALQLVAASGQPDPGTVISDVIVVTNESPLLDERKITTGTTVSRVELEKIPTARDPWAIVTQTPGVLSDRVNVGGSESGQQAMFRAPAVSDAENSFSIDGVVITDMAAVGSSPTYYDFDQLEEVQVSTGGSDIEKISAGASLNLVTKRGTNTPRGSTRFLVTKAAKELGVFEQGTPDLQSDLENGDGNGGCEGCVQTLNGTPGNQTNEVLDFGFEAGGPIVEDRLWAWGSYGRNDIKQFAQNGDSDNTLLENSAIKINGQATEATSLVGSWNRGDKVKTGRRPGSNFSADSTWNQSGPTEIWKLEGTQVLSSSLYVTGLFSYVDGGFQLVPQGAAVGDSIPVTGEPLLDTDGIWKNTYLQIGTTRTTDNWQADGSYFFDTGHLSHELKFGVSYRKFDDVSSDAYPGRGVAHLTCEALGTCGLDQLIPIPGDDLALVIQQPESPVSQEYTAGWLQDTLTFGDWTLNAGLRYDLQKGKNEASSIAANEAFPDLLPAKEFGGNDPGFEWKTFSPRLGATYALGSERKTLFRASYSRFAGQLQTGDILQVNPLGFTVLQAWYDDANGNNFFDPGEDYALASASGFDPNDPGALVSPNAVDSDYSPSLTDEIVLGAEHALRPEFVVGVDLTWRKVQDLAVFRPYIIDETGTKRLATVDDYVPSNAVCSAADPSCNGFVRSNGQDIPNLPDGTPWEAQFFGYRPGITDSGGTLLTNGDSTREYLGGALTFTKRLANRWMARGYFQYGKADWSFGDQDRFYDNPTDETGAFDGTADDPNGGLYVVQSAGSGPFENVFVQANWSANINGLYQVAPEKPWGFNIAGNLLARQGYPLPYAWTENLPQGLGDVTASAVRSVDQYRADNIYDVDLRVEKDMAFTDSLSGILSLDAFNVLNETYVMGRDVSLDTPQANFVTQSLSPRIFRLGFRLSWR